MAISSKLENIGNSCIDIRLSIKEQDNTLAAGSITTLGDDIRTIENRNYAYFFYEKQVLNEENNQLENKLFIKKVHIKNSGLGSDSWDELGGYNPERDCKANIIAAIIPSNINELGTNIFKNCKTLRYINLQNIELFGYGTFRGCENLTIDASNLEKIKSGYFSFANCKNLTGTLDLSNFTLSDWTRNAMNAVALSAFQGSGISNIIWKGDETNLSRTSNWFRDCKNLDYDLTNLPTTIENFSEMFQDTKTYGIINLPNLIDITARNGNKTDNNLNNTFGKYDGVNSLRIENLGKLTTVSVLNHGGLEYIKLSSYITRIGNYFLHEGTYNHLTEIDLSDCNNLTQIGVRCFNGMNAPNLKSITFPAGITSIGGYFMIGQYNIDYIVFLAETPPTASHAYSPRTQWNNFCANKIYVPYSEDHSTLNAYQNATNWSALASIMYELNSDGTVPE